MGKLCACGCGQELKPGKTGKNFYSAACVVAVLSRDPKLRAELGEENFKLALAMLKKAGKG